MPLPPPGSLSPARARARRYLLIEDQETGDVVMPLISLKPVFEANYSRKLSGLKHRLVAAPAGSALAAACPPGAALYWQWAMEAPASIKQAIRQELGAENMATVRGRWAHGMECR